MKAFVAFYMNWPVLVERFVSDVQRSDLLELSECFEGRRVIKMQRALAGVF